MTVTRCLVARNTSHVGAQWTPVRRAWPILSVVVFAACGATLAAPAPASAPVSAPPALPTAAVVTSAEGELTFDVAELI